LFPVGWIGYTYYADRAARSARGLRGVTHRHREAWGRQMVFRENRIVSRIDRQPDEQRVVLRQHDDLHHRRLMAVAGTLTGWSPLPRIFPSRA